MNGQQTSVTFDTEGEGAEFQQALNTIGDKRAMKAWGITLTKQAAKRSTSMTVAEWLDTHIASLSGVEKSTLYRYRAYLRNDIGPSIGQIPIELLEHADVSAWVEDLADDGASGKTIANEHGFLSSALNAAVEAKVIPSIPAAGTRLRRAERQEMAFLTHDEYQQLLARFTAHWLPLIEFMVASGARFGEVTALRAGDVDVVRGTVHIGRAWKRTYEARRRSIRSARRRPVSRCAP